MWVASSENIRAFSLHSYSPQHPIILLADREGPDQTVRMHRLIWAFAVRLCQTTCIRVIYYLDRVVISDVGSKSVPLWQIFVQANFNGSNPMARLP